jgi:hypothetical protein
MSMIIDGSAGVTFPNSTVQASAGQVLQVVSFPYSTQFSTSSTSFTSTGIATSITPKFSTSKIFIAVTMPIFNTGTNSLSERFTIFRGTTSGTNLGVATWGMGLWNLAGYTTCAMSYLDSPATTSSTTYTVAISSEGGTNTVYSCPFSTVASITLMEIAQ